MVLRMTDAGETLLHKAGVGTEACEAVKLLLKRDTNLTGKGKR